MGKMHTKAGPLNKKEMSKQQRENHSFIEKKRRLKINKEYYALKYLVPACRKAVMKEGYSVVDGSLHKLRVLQETVDYIQHLHRMIGSQTSPFSKTKDVAYALDVSEYRESEGEFDFDELFTAARLESFTSPLDDSKSSSQRWEKLATPVWNTMVDTIYDQQPRSFSLPSPALPSPALPPQAFAEEKRTKIGHILN